MKSVRWGQKSSLQFCPPPPFPGHIPEEVPAEVRSHQSRNMALVINASRQKLENLCWPALGVRIRFFLWISFLNLSRQPVASRQGQRVWRAAAERKHAHSSDSWKGEATVRRIKPSQGHSAVTSTVCDNARLYIAITTYSKMTVKNSFLWRHMGNIHSLRVPLASIPLPTPSPCCRHMDPIVTRSVKVRGLSCCWIRVYPRYLLLNFTTLEIQYWDQ